MAGSSEEKIKVQRNERDSAQTETERRTEPSSEPPYHAFVNDGSKLVVAVGQAIAQNEVYQTVLAHRVLQTVADYRGALRDWFAATATGGHLIVVVPHAFLYDRCIRLPSPWDRSHRRLYTPAVLAKEIEEALPPNNYRILIIQDDDRGYDYNGSANEPPEGPSDVIAVIQKIGAPYWKLTGGESASTVKTDRLFFTPATRIEGAYREPCTRILLLKLDHLGDFILSLPAIERVRKIFGEADITLVVGSWNEEMALQSGLVDHVIPFDIFPRNASEEVIDVRGKNALFRQRITESYDLAIDLRTDSDTRFLLDGVSARTKAGLGLQTVFPFLDIFLPIDFNRDGRERSLSETLSHHDFGSAPTCFRNAFRIGFDGKSRPPRGALLWGPYTNLKHGSYIFEPLMEIGNARFSGTLTTDITLDGVVVAQTVVDGSEHPTVSFDVGPDGGQFEFRIWAKRWNANLPFSFYGGKLWRKGSGNVLHQTEYLQLLVELVGIRMASTGILCQARD
jgi:hypothetical protein